MEKKDFILVCGGYGNSEASITLRIIISLLVGTLQLQLTKTHLNQKAESSISVPGWRFLVWGLFLSLGLTQMTFILFLLDSSIQLLRHLYSIYNDLPNCSFSPLVLHLTITLLLTEFPMLCSPSLWPSINY